MKELAPKPSRDRQRNESRGSTSNPQRRRRSGLSALASNQALRKIQSEAKMALTCKVQYLDDTDPFASTNFPEPTRPPTYTFHLNIPLCQQVDGLHRLLCAPHAIDDVALQLSHNGCYLELENTLEEQADLLEGFLDSRKNTIILRTSLSVRVHNCIAKLLAASGRELRRALFSLKQIFQDDKDLVHEFVNSDGLNALITVGQDADQNYQNYILRAIGQIMLYVDGMNGVINHNETIQWLYSLTASKFRLVAKTALKLLLVFVEYTESNSRLLYEAVQVDDNAQGLRWWAEIVGILAEKDSLGDEEILIYAITLVNKVLYATPDQDTFYDIIDALEEQGMGNIVKMHQERRGTNIDFLEQLNIYEMSIKIEDGDEDLPAFTSSPSIRQRRRTTTTDIRGGERRKSRRHNSVSKLDLMSSGLDSYSTVGRIGSLDRGLLHKVSSAPDVTSRNGERPPSPVRSLGSSSPSSSTQEMDEIDEKERCRQARRERRAARRAALGMPPERESSSTPSLNVNNKYNDSTATINNSNNYKYREEGRGGHLDIPRNGDDVTSSRTSPSTSPRASPRSSPRASPHASPQFARRRDRFNQAEEKDETPQKKSHGNWEERRKAREESKRQDNQKTENHEQETRHYSRLGSPREQRATESDAMKIDTSKLRSDDSSSEESVRNAGNEVHKREKRRELHVDSAKDSSASEKEEPKSPRRTPKLNEIGRTPSVTDKGGSIRSPPLDRRESSEKRSSICEGFNKKMMLSMLYQTSTDDLFAKKPDASSMGESVHDRRTRLMSSGEAETNNENAADAATVALNAVQDTIKKLDAVEEEGKESSAPEGNFEGLIKQAKKNLLHEKEDVDDEAARLEADRIAEEEKRRKEEEEEAARRAAEEAARLQELEWERMITLKRSLIIKDFDFTDLGEDDDVDIFESDDHHDETDAPPPPTYFGDMAPPPPPLAMMCPPPPPPGGMPPPPPPGPPGLPGHLNKANKKKLVRLFWQEVKNSPLINGVNKTIWGNIDKVDIDTKKLEHLFENKTSAKLKQRAEGDEKDRRKEIVVLDLKRSQTINIGLTKLPPIRTLKQAIMSMDSTVIDREGVEKILQLQPTPEEKTKIQEAQLANPDIPLGTAEQFLLTMASLNELAPRLQLWLFKLDYDLLEKEVAEPLMDLKEALEEINKNKTFKHILATLLAIGNFLNGKQVKGFQLEYLSKVPEVKDTVHKQSLLYHLCCMVMDKFPETTDLYSELGACHRSSRVDFDIVAENLKKLKENCKKSWEHLSVVAKHDNTKQLKSRMSELLTDAQERITILKVVHRRVMNRFRKMLLYLGVSPSVTKKTKVHEFCKIISEFSLEYRTTREKVLEQKKKRENIRERNKTRGKLITESFRSAGRSPSEERVDEALQKALFSNGDQLDGCKEKLKSSTLPNSRSRIRSNRSSLSHDEFPDDNTDEVMDMLVKSATAPNTKTRVRTRNRTPNSNRKSARRTLKSGISAEDLEKLTKHVKNLESK